MGDLVDGGPDSIGVLDLVLWLQKEAQAAGGRLIALLGNHDVLLVAARRFPHHVTGHEGRTLLDDWRDNGGRDPDLDRLTAEHVAWLTRLPAMAQAEDTLLVHADSVFYANYGGTVDEANSRIGAVVAGTDPAALERLLLQFDEQRGLCRGSPGWAHVSRSVPAGLRRAAAGAWPHAHRQNHRSACRADQRAVGLPGRARGRRRRLDKEGRAGVRLPAVERCGASGNSAA